MRSRRNLVALCVLLLHGLPGPCSVAMAQDTVGEITIKTGETAVIFMSPEGKILNVVRVGGTVSAVAPATKAAKPAPIPALPPAQPATTPSQALPSCPCGPDCPCRKQSPVGFQTYDTAAAHLRRDEELAEIAARMRAIAAHYSHSR